MLFNCHTCGKLISSKSQACPYCESSVKKTRTTSREVFHPYYSQSHQVTNIANFLMSKVSTIIEK